MVTKMFIKVRTGIDVVIVLKNLSIVLAYQDINKIIENQSHNT